VAPEVAGSNPVTHPTFHTSLDHDSAGAPYDSCHLRKCLAAKCLRWLGRAACRWHVGFPDRSAGFSQAGEQPPPVGAGQL